MSTGKRIWVGFIALAALTGGLWLFKSPQRPPNKPLDLTIYFTGDTRGRLVPCGCFTGQFGGLSRLKTYLQENASPMDVKVDVGDAIGGAEDYQRIQYQFILRAYAGMNFDALNIGQREARLPLPQLLEIRKTSPVTLLSANLYDKQTGQRIFAPCKMLQRGPYKIAVVGVVDPQGMTDGPGEGLRIEPAELTLEKLLPSLRKESDAIVLLAFTDEDGLARLARQFYEPNVILGGRVSQPSQRLLMENRSVILYTANESRTVGFLKANFAPKFSPSTFDLLMLHDKIPEHDEILQLARDYRETVRNARLDIDDPKHLDSDSVPGVKNRAAYVGSENCVACHQAAAAVWEGSAHRHAFDSLTNKRADADPGCIACHTVGFGSPSGYRREFKGARMIDVGCESCHGAGSLHLEQRKNGAKIAFTFRPLGAGDCKSCHHGEFSRPFEWEAFWDKIKHGKENAANKEGK